MTSYYESDKYLAHRIRVLVTEHEENFLGAFIGRTGRGKSWSAMRLCELVDPDFSIDRIVFTPSEFRDQVFSDLPVGSAVLWDDAGVGISSRDWQSTLNKDILKIAQSFRYKRLVTIFTMPAMDFIDSKVRYLMHMFFKGIHKDEDKGIAVFLGFKLEPNPFGSRPYTKYPRAPVKGGPAIRFRVFEKPSADLVMAYRKKKQERLDALHQGLEEKAPKGLPGALRALRDTMGMSEREIGHIVGMSQQLVHYHIVKE